MRNSLNGRKAWFLRQAGLKHQSLVEAWHGQQSARAVHPHNLLRRGMKSAGLPQISLPSSFSFATSAPSETTG
jgi:hypothetical protein